MSKLDYKKQTWAIRIWQFTNEVIEYLGLDDEIFMLGGVEIEDECCGKYDFSIALSYVGLRPFHGYVPSIEFDNCYRYMGDNHSIYMEKVYFSDNRTVLFCGVVKESGKE